MKFIKILVLLLIMINLIGCSKLKSQTSTATNSQAQPVQSQASASKGQNQVPTNKPQVSTPQVNTLSFQWLGTDKDQVSPTELKTDGKPDGHFHITVPFAQPVSVKSIWIRYSEFGKSYKWGWIYNKNLPLNGYKMAVFDSLGQLLVPQVDNGYRVNGLTDFDLYISELNGENGRDTLRFEKNQTYNLEIDYLTQNNEEKSFLSKVTIM
jgi:hypothetical protein